MPKILIKKSQNVYFSSVSPDAEIILGEPIDPSKIILYQDVVEKTSFGKCDSLAYKSDDTIEIKARTLKRTFAKLGKAARRLHPEDSDELCVIINLKDLERYSELGDQAVKDYGDRKRDRHIVIAKGQVAKICAKIC